MSDVNNIPGNDDTIVTLTYEDRHEGWHSTGELENEAVNETVTADQVASVITDYKLGATTEWGDGNALDELRDQDLLEDYERGSFDFENYVTEQIKENFNTNSQEDFELKKMPDDYNQINIDMKLSSKHKTFNKFEKNPKFEKRDDG